MFHRSEPQWWALEYLKGLIFSVESKNNWQLAEQSFGSAQEATPYRTECNSCCPLTGGTPSGPRRSEGLRGGASARRRRVSGGGRGRFPEEKETSRWGCSVRRAARRTVSNIAGLRCSLPMPLPREDPAGLGKQAVTVLMKNWSHHRSGGTAVAYWPRMDGKPAA